VASAGYIEVPSRAFESCLGVERPRQAGLSHHRWLIDIEGQHIRFLQKFHAINADWRLALPTSYRRRLTPENSVTWLWWQDSFSFEEIHLHGAAQEAELRRFVEQLAPPARWRLALDSAWRRARRAARQGRSWVRRQLMRGGA
jgi:hypothetical protein